MGRCRTGAAPAAHTPLTDGDRAVYDPAEPPRGMCDAVLSSPEVNKADDARKLPAQGPDRGSRQHQGAPFGRCPAALRPDVPLRERPAPVPLDIPDAVRKIQPGAVDREASADVVRQAENAVPAFHEREQTGTSPIIRRGGGTRLENRSRPATRSPGLSSSISIPSGPKTPPSADAVIVRRSMRTDPPGSSTKCDPSGVTTCSEAARFPRLSVCRAGMNAIMFSPDCCLKYSPSKRLCNAQASRLSDMPGRCSQV
jgi:hypothetical protein